MIHESYPWKQDLLRRIALIKKYNSVDMFQKNEEQAYTVLEKSIFYSAFIVRKLLDCKSKLSDAADKYSIKMQKVKPIKKITYLNSHKIDKNYNWENKENVIISGRDICNFLIHSYVFNFLWDEQFSIITDFIVSSDFDKNKCLYCITLDEWLKYLYFIAKDDVVGCKLMYDININDYKFLKKDNKLTTDAINFF